ncbi:MAG: glycosyltransferase [Lachnospiraceae bacterium]|nr:glycosyltransferase [Lachnospiraceae bacterium]
MKPLVSVCIPAYNSARYIEDTVTSVLNQSYSHVEVVIVDDGSVDNTCEIVSSIQDERVRLIRNETNLGMTANWNKCVRETKGKYVKLLCADDVLYRDSLRKEMAAMLKHPDVALVVSDTALIDEDGKKRGRFKRYPRHGKVDGKKVAKRSLMLKSYFGAPCNTLFSREAYEKAGGFDVDFPYILDFDLWIRIACMGSVYVIHEELNGFRVRNDSNTGRLIRGGRPVYNDEHRRLVEKHNAIGIVHLNRLERFIGVCSRKIRNELIAVYLRVNARHLG